MPAACEPSRIFFTATGDDVSGDTTIIWAHGWGQSHQNLLPLAHSLEKQAQSLLVDLPGFGQSPAPDQVWDSADYAEALARFIETHAKGPVIWAGHSFGGKIGLRLAARRPDLIKGLILLGSAGLKPRRPLLQAFYIYGRIRLYKILKKLAGLGLLDFNRLKDTFGSPDYRNAGPMRSILVKTLQEDLTEDARTIACPVLMIYGEDDKQTPPEIGRRLLNLIPAAKLLVLKEEDHYSILGSGRHIVTPKIKEFITMQNTESR